MLIKQAQVEGIIEEDITLIIMSRQFNLRTKMSEYKPLLHLSIYKPHANNQIHIM